MATNPRWRKPLAQWRRSSRPGSPSRCPRRSCAPASSSTCGRSTGTSRSTSGCSGTCSRHPRPRPLPGPPGQAGAGQRAAARLLPRARAAEGGEHRDTLDIKRGGSGPSSSSRASTRCRSAARRSTPGPDRGGAAGRHPRHERADDLRDAFEFVSYVRLRHQAAQVRRGEPPTTSSLRATCRASTSGTCARRSHRPPRPVGAGEPLPGVLHLVSRR